MSTKPQEATLLPAKADFGAFARRLEATGDTWGPWLEDGPRVHSAPLVLSGDLQDRLYEAARRIGALFEEVATIVWEAPELLDSFFGLTPWQKRMWKSSGGWWHSFARIDAFVCADGAIRIAEINADTPSGQDDATALSAFVHGDHPHLIDPNIGYADHLWSTVTRTVEARTGRRGGPRSIGIIYPTDLPEDLTVIRLYRRWFEARGARVEIGSPYNLRRGPDGGVRLFGVPVDCIVRHYKTDWWGERLPVWVDEPPYDDPEPLERSLSLLLEAEEAGRVAVMNPFGSILPQNKLSLAFFWEERARFSDEGRATIEDHVPETVRAETLGKARLLAERSRWVLKSDFGCEGDEVAVGAWVKPELWRDYVEALSPGRWVAQRFMTVRPIEGGWLPNLGVYLIGGAPAGLFGRLLPPGETLDETSRVVPILIDRGDGGR